MATTSQLTPLHAWHVAHNAHMGHFGGYEMPLWYPTGAKHEHQSVISHAGLFDTAHMATILISGQDAFHLLQKCFSRDLTACMGKSRRPLAQGRCLYGVFLNQRGEVIDDAIVFYIRSYHYLVIVNAGMGSTITHHLEAHKHHFDVLISDCTEKFSKIDIQGPLSAKIVSTVIHRPDEVFARFPYFSFKGYPEADIPVEHPVYLRSGEPLLISRTGYTGEFGFELLIKKEHVSSLWETLIHNGQPAGLTACGLAARDSLRTGALLPLSQKDIGSWPFVNNPWLFALPYDETGSVFSKSFLGDKKLSVPGDSYTYAFAGFDPRKIEATDAQVFLEDEEKAIGRVLSCTTDMAIGRINDRIYSMASPDKPEAFSPRGLCCGFMKVCVPLQPGTRLTIKDNRRAIRVEMVNRIRPHQTALRPINEMI